MSSNRQFIHTQLEAAWQARRSGDRELAIRTLIHAIAEGDGTTEENLRVLVEEARRYRASPRRAPEATAGGQPGPN